MDYIWSFPCYRSIPGKLRSWITRWGSLHMFKDTEPMFQYQTYWNIYKAFFQSTGRCIKLKAAKALTVPFLFSLIFANAVKDHVDNLPYQCPFGPTI